MGRRRRFLFFCHSTLTRPPGEASRTQGEELAHPGLSPRAHLPSRRKASQTLLTRLQGGEGCSKRLVSVACSRCLGASRRQPLGLGAPRIPLGLHRFETSVQVTSIDRSLDQHVLRGVSQTFNDRKNRLRTARHNRCSPTATRSVEGFVGPDIAPSGRRAPMREAKSSTPKIFATRPDGALRRCLVLRAVKLKRS